MIKLSLPYNKEDLKKVKAGDLVSLSGKLYVARDQAHLNLVKNIDNLPFDINNAAVYYMGPSLKPDNLAIGAAGPTTSNRMDPFSPILLEKGLLLMIGKGPRDKKVLEAIKKYEGLYLQAFGGCGALYASKIISSKVICYPELGPEAILELEVKDFEAICLIDSKANYLSSAII